MHATRGAISSGRAPARPDASMAFAAIARRACCGAAISAGAMSARRRTESSVESQETHRFDRGEVQVSLPQSYETGVSKRKLFDVLYVLESGPGSSLFSSIVEAVRSDHESVITLPGRQWHPDLIIAGVRVRSTMSADAFLAFVGECVVPIVDENYCTKPYAAGRALCGCDSCGSGTIVRLVLQSDCASSSAQLFRFYMVSSGEESMAASKAVALPEKTAAFVCGAVGPTHALATMVNERTAGKRDTTTMFVNRHGEQTYTQHASSLDDSVTVELVDGTREDVSRALVARGVAWLGARLEKQKLASLGSLLPWHEFK